MKVNGSAVVNIVGRIQNNIYNLPRTEIIFFDFYKKVEGKWVKLNFEDSVKFAKDNDLPFVPILDEHYKLPETAQEMLELSDKNTIFGYNLKHKREGFVARLRDDYSVSFKVKIRSIQYDIQIC